MSQVAARISTKALRACDAPLRLIQKLDAAIKAERPLRDDIDKQWRASAVRKIINVLTKDFGRGKYTPSKRKLRKAGGK